MIDIISNIHITHTLSCRVLETIMIIKKYHKFILPLGNVIVNNTQIVVENRKIEKYNKKPTKKLKLL